MVGMGTGAVNTSSDLPACVSGGGHRSMELGLVFKDRCSMSLLLLARMPCPSLRRMVGVQVCGALWVLSCTRFACTPMGG